MSNKVKRYIVSTVVPGAPLNLAFFRTIKHYCKKTGAKLLILKAEKVYASDILDERIPLENIVTEDLELNSKIKISTIPINPQSSDPLISLDRFSQSGSFIFASPRQRLKTIPTTSSLPHILCTPGAMTRAYYRPTKNGVLASRDHVAGAILVETKGSIEYHFRHIRADAKGSFIDLGKKYTEDGKVLSVKVEALVPGDLHIGEMDPRVEQCLYEINTLLKPKYFICHDLFNGLSVSHHTQNKYLYRGTFKKELSLERELKLTYDFLKKLKDKFNQNILVVKSNHDLFLNQWLDSGAYLKDAENHVLGLELALSQARGNDPLEYALNRYGKLDKVKFLKLDESLRLTSKRVEVGFHGSSGSNGARASLTSTEKALGCSITGHSHSPSILRESYVTGTSTYLKLGYNKGPSSWVATACILYESGDRQLVNFIQGKWRA